jgi:hypothetical protein
LVASVRVGDQVHEPVQLGVAEEQQVGGVGRLPAGLDPQRGQDARGDAVGGLAFDPGARREPLGEQGGDLLGAGAELVGGQVVDEAGAGGPLPCLGGHPRATHSPVDRLLGGAGVVAVEVGRRHGLQDVDIDEGTCGHDFSSAGTSL